MILINVQPTESTVVRVDRQPQVPPSLVVTDGHATVFFSPWDGADGPLLAVEFAERLGTCLRTWHQACHELASALQGRPPGGW